MCQADCILLGGVHETPKCMHISLFALLLIPFYCNIHVVLTLIEFNTFKCQKKMKRIGTLFSKMPLFSITIDAHKPMFHLINAPPAVISDTVVGLKSKLSFLKKRKVITQKESKRNVLNALK